MLHFITSESYYSGKDDVSLQYLKNPTIVSVYTKNVGMVNEIRKCVCRLLHCKGKKRFSSSNLEN